MHRPLVAAHRALRFWSMLWALALASAPPSATAAPSASPSVPDNVRGAEILWDRWGIPHIYAASATGLAYAFGWAQMHNHGDLLLTLVGQARGRGAEYWGEGFLEEDRWVRTVGGPARARAWYRAQPPAFRSYLDAFAAGINAYARTHPERIADSVEVVLPVRGEDCLAHLHRVLYSYFITSQSRVRNDTRAWRERDARGRVEPETEPGSDLGAASGSNGWAIGPRRSASRRAMLLANPHLSWSDAFTWLEAQLVIRAPGSVPAGRTSAGSGTAELDVYGAALIGMPVLQIAFNPQLGWTHTVNTQDGEDLYELTLDHEGYRWDGGARAFEIETQVLAVRRPGGVPRLDTLRIRRSVHGPVVAEKPGRAVALRVVGLEAPLVYEQWWDMARSRSLAEFERAIGRMQVSGQNILYADRAGHILYHYGGNTPVRPRGDRTFWSGIVRGDTSATLWTRLHPYQAMPRVLDPKSGWLQNANDPPWSCTFPPAVAPDSFPNYLASLAMELRAQRSARMLDQDPSLTFDELVRYKHSTRMELADRLLDDLLGAVRAGVGGPAEAGVGEVRVGAGTVARARSLRRAAAVLEHWDRCADSGSRGAVLFVTWWEEYRRSLPAGRSPYARVWSQAAPRTTPDGLADSALAVRALATAAAEVESRYGAPDVAWGTVYRIERDGLDLPGNGAARAYGVFRNVSYEAAGADRYRAVGGDSFVMAVEFGLRPRAMAVVAAGNASQPGSPHRTDQLPLFARKVLRPIWLDRSEVERNLEAKERF
jgi:acyl-homoserine-lactone acylase